jgi:energy-coupling factor transporter ATP-binding protein EcfA2
VHLRSVTLKGFKSFPDRTRMEFTPGVSVIVGPNGSGKSNVTDAVLWAMGEQSPLAVRGQSMQDVIFAGAHGVQARSEAEVEVVIDNGDGQIDLPMSEISILRRLDRSGEGEYRVNGAKCRLTDVLEILSDTGLGKEMHSVVSQGRVEGIVTSKPKDRRLLIEEAAGLGKHRKRRRRAQLKLARTQDNLDRALDVRRRPPSCTSASSARRTRRGGHWPARAPAPGGSPWPRARLPPPRRARRPARPRPRWPRSPRSASGPRPRSLPVARSASGCRAASTPPAPPGSA